MAGQISTRFGVTGHEAVERAFDNLAKKGEEVGRRTKAGADAAGEALGKFSAGAGKASGEVDKFDRVLQRHVERVDQVARAKRQAADSESVYAEAVAKGRISAAEGARLSELNTAKLSAMVSAQALAARGAADHAGAMKLNAFQAQNLAYQLNDVVVSLASGQRPLTVLMQQGSQITPIFGGVAGTMRAVGSAAASMVSPIGLAVTAAATLGAGFYAAMTRAADLDKQLKQLRVTMAVTGAAPGMSPGQAQQAAIAFARLPGVNRDTAQAASQIALSNPLLTADLFAKALPAARDWAAVTGKDIPDAMQDLVQAMFGGVEAASKLAERYDFLKVRDIERIRTLNEQGKATEAATLLLDKFAARMRGSADALQNDWTRATSSMGNAWDGFLDTLAKTGPIQGTRAAILGLLKDTTAALEGDLPKLAKMAAVLTNPFAFIASLAAGGINAALAPGQAPDNKAQIAEVTKQITEMQALLRQLEANPKGQLANRGRALFGDDYIAETKRKVDALVAELARLEKAGKDASAAAGQGARDVTDAETDKARREISAAAAGTSAGQIEAARNALERLQQQYDLTGVTPGERGRDKKTGALLSIEDTVKLIQLQDQYNGAIRGTLTYDQQWSRTQREQQELLRAGVQDRAALTAKQQAYNEAISKGKSEDEANRRGLEAFNLVKQQQADASGRALTAMTAEAQASLAVADAYLKAGDGAAAYARELEKARIAVLSGQDIGTSPEDFARRQLGNQAAAGAAGIAERITALNGEAEALLRVADAERKSSVAGEDAARREQILTETAKLRSLAIASGNQELVDYIDKIVPRYLQASDRVADANRAIEASRLNRQYDPQAQLRDDLAGLEKLAATGKLSARAFQGAWTEAYIRAGERSDHWVDGAIAGLLEYARQAQAIGETVAGAMVRSLSAADDVIAKLLLRRKVDVRSFIEDVSLDLVRGFVRQNITGPIAGFFGNLFTGGPQTAGAAAGGGSWAGMGFGGSSAGGGFNPLGMLGGGSFGGGASGWLGDAMTWLRTPIGAENWSTLAPGMYGPPNPGAAFGGLGGITPMQGLGALAGIGSGIFQLASGGGSASSIIGGVGSMIGAGVSLIPGIGQIAGPIIGIASSLLGSLFKKEPTFAAQGFHSYNPASGRYGGRVGYETNMKAPLAPQLGNDVLKLLGAFGGSVTPGMAPPEYYLWSGYKDSRMDGTVTAEGSKTYADLLAKVWQSGQIKTADEAQWAARTELWTDSPVNGEWTPLPINSLTTDSEKLMQQVALLIMKAGVRDGSFTGLTETSQKIIRNFPDADTKGLGEALTWGRDTYDVLQRAVPATAVETGLKQIRDSFEATIAKAEEFRLATDGLTAAMGRAINKFATDWGQNIEDQLLGMKDPAALQRVQVERERERVLKEWDDLNKEYLAGNISTLIERNKIEELYGEKLNAIVSQQLAGLQDLWKRLTYGDLSSASPAVVLSGAQSTYQDLLAKAQAGDSTALAGLSGAAADYVNAQRAYSGNDARFEALRISLLSDIAPWIAANSGATTTGAASAGDDTVAALMVSQAQLQRTVADLVDALAATNRELSRLRAA